MKDLKKLSKKKLEELGREHGVELDRRKAKSALIEEIRVAAENPVEVSQSVYDLKEEMANEVEEEVQPVAKEAVSFRSLRAAKAYAAANGGKVVEKGKFYVL